MRHLPALEPRYSPVVGSVRTFCRRKFSQCHAPPGPPLRRHAPPYPERSPPPQCPDFFAARSPRTTRPSFSCPAGLTRRSSSIAPFPTSHRNLCFAAAGDNPSRRVHLPLQIVPASPALPHCRTAESVRSSHSESLS